ncbi:MAG: hypothetical protein JXB23_09590 [Candidatus Aminicenantes bacterium]|nr:hypothetical protein [Candidatus Aminicenantes bacterium]
MKAFLFVLILGVAGYFGYNHFVKPLTGEEQEVQAVEKKFDTAVEQYLQAVRKMGGMGTATVADVDYAVRKVKSTRTALTNLKRRLKEEAAIERANKLEVRMREFYSKNDLIWF